MKKLLAGLLVAAMSFSMLAGCGSTEAPAEAPADDFDEVCKVKDSEAEERLSEFLASHPCEMQQCDRSIAAKYFGGGPRV